MQRVGVTNKYLLLPVQEREDNATIKVLVNGQQVQKLNIRLAVDKVDYGDEVQRHFRHSQS